MSTSCKPDFIRALAFSYNCDVTATNTHPLQLCCCSRYFSLRVRLSDTRLRINRAPSIMQQMHGAVFKGLLVAIYLLNRDVNALRLDVEVRSFP
jgi:hypothetical protein